MTIVNEELSCAVIQHLIDTHVLCGGDLELTPECVRVLWKDIVRAHSQVEVTHKKALDSSAAWDIQEQYKGKPHGWIQWKGTSVCMDIYCKCGHHSHIDADFAYHVKCPKCKTVYFCNGHIEFVELEKEPDNCVVMEDTEENLFSGIGHLFIEVGDK